MLHRYGSRRGILLFGLGAMCASLSIIVTVLSSGRGLDLLNNDAVRSLQNYDNFDSYPTAYPTSTISAYDDDKVMLSDDDTVESDSVNSNKTATSSACAQNSSMGSAYNCVSHRSLSNSQLNTLFPSKKPTQFPSFRPSKYPSVQPSGQPSRIPSSQPSGQPSGEPSSRPTMPLTGLPKNTFNQLESPYSVSVIRFVLLISISIYLGAYCGAVSPVTWLIVAESFPTRIRSKAISAIYCKNFF
jgi:hypothetical protein